MRLNQPAMSPAATILAIALTFSAVLTPSGARAEERFNVLSDDEQARMERGEVIVHLERTDCPLRRMRIIGLVNAPAAEVYAAYSDYERYDEIFAVKNSRILARDGDTLKVNAVMQFPWPVGERWVTNQTKLSPGTLSFSYERLEGSIAEYTGSLTIVPRGPAACQVFYIARIDPGIPFVPRWLIDQVQQNIAPSTILLMRDYLKRKKAGS